MSHIICLSGSRSKMEETEEEKVVDKIKKGILFGKGGFVAWCLDIGSKY
jgi:hypothetical protein